MLFDGNRYATEKSQIRLPNKVFEASSFMLSENSGIDAAIYEGWLDLKVRNDTDNTFQVEIRVDENTMHGCILSQVPVDADSSDTII